MRQMLNVLGLAADMALGGLTILAGLALIVGGATGSVWLR